MSVLVTRHPPSPRQPRSRAWSAEHLAFLIWLVVVVAEQVQECRGRRAGAARRPCHGRRCAPGPRRSRGTGRRHRAARSPRRLDQRAVEVVHRERQHIGGAGFAHELLVQPRSSPAHRPASPTAQRADATPISPSTNCGQPRRAHARRLQRRTRCSRRPSSDDLEAADGAAQTCSFVEPRVGIDDVADQPVPDDVSRRQLGEVHVVDSVEDALARPSARWRFPLAGRSG